MWYNSPLCGHKSWGSHLSYQLCPALLLNLWIWAKSRQLYTRQCYVCKTRTHNVKIQIVWAMHPNIKITLHLTFFLINLITQRLTTVNCTSVMVPLHNLVLPVFYMELVRGLTCSFILSFCKMPSTIGYRFKTPFTRFAAVKISSCLLETRLCPRMPKIYWSSDDYETRGQSVAISKVKKS